MVNLELISVLYGRYSQRDVWSLRKKRRERGGWQVANLSMSLTDSLLDFKLAFSHWMWKMLEYCCEAEIVEVYATSLVDNKIFSTSLDMFTYVNYWSVVFLLEKEYLAWCSHVNERRWLIHIKFSIMHTSTMFELRILFMFLQVFILYMVYLISWYWAQMWHLCPIEGSHRLLADD